MQFSSAWCLLSAALLECWPQVCLVKIMFTELPTDRFVSTRKAKLPLSFKTQSQHVSSGAVRVGLEEGQPGPSLLFQGQAGLPRRCSSEGQVSNSRVPVGVRGEEEGRAALGRRLRPLKQREDSVVQAAGSTQTEPVFGVDHPCY